MAETTPPPRALHFRKFRQATYSSQNRGSAYIFVNKWSSKNIMASAFFHSIRKSSPRWVRALLAASRRRDRRFLCFAGTAVRPPYERQASTDWVHVVVPHSSFSKTGLVSFSWGWKGYSGLVFSVSDVLAVTTSKLTPLHFFQRKQHLFWLIKSSTSWISCHLASA